MATAESSHLIEACARAAYEVNRVYCIALGDLSFGPWEQAPEWQQQANRKGVLAALSGKTPEQSHVLWLYEKRLSGWRYGPNKSPEKKEHPCMVPYAELPPEQRAKDALYVAIVKAMKEALSVECDSTLHEMKRTERGIG